MGRKVSGTSDALSSPEVKNIFRVQDTAPCQKAISKQAVFRSRQDQGRDTSADSKFSLAPGSLSDRQNLDAEESPRKEKPKLTVHRTEPGSYMPKKRSVSPIAKLMVGARKSSYTNLMNSTIEIYTQHFGLKERPFTLLPDPDFLFWSPAHQRAFTMLEYGTLTGAPITLITGEVGAGKTTLLQHFLNNLDDNVKVGLVSNAHGSRGELLRWVLMSLDQPADNSSTYVDLFEQFQEYLIHEYGAGNRVILIFDEAQNLSQESLEELRMFTNINANKDELLQLVLVGQPELREIVQQPNLRQFAQRVASSFHLKTMDEATTLAYIGHRLKKAGAQRNLFTESASRLIHSNTRGVPRLVNQLCDLSMVYAFAKNQKTVTLLTVEQVLEDGAFFGAPHADDDDEDEAST